MTEEDELAYASIAEGCAVSLPFAPAIGLNRVLGLTDTESLEAALGWFAGRGGTRHVQIDASSASASVLQWISDRGLKRNGASWVKLACPAPVSPGYRNGAIEVRLASEAEAELFGALMCRGFGFPPRLAPLWSGIVGKPSWSCHLAYLDETPVGSAIMYTAGGYAWLGGGTTLPEYRNRGVQTALIHDRMSIGAALGVTVFASETAEPESGKSRVSYDNLVKLGFEPVYTRQNYLIED
ncbi:GNAT family N-acetyltransferase [Rhizobium sp. SL42]|uniref:GNAT family N-acetyltransferase n=1 Tax=Rhizobium sp. SL42 TaxID=2806346 RepID=UPI001F17DB88|nr:GNAT family N-acetyltransferase [Rhizobium sp. SL42]UJW77164.1 N-acetyltransferase [Rhizobium sp. SL42]